MKKILAAGAALLVLTACTHVAPQVTIDSIYEQWQQLDAVSYRMQITESVDNELAGYPSMRIHAKGKSKTRLEIEGEGTVFIVNPERGIEALYYPARNAYVDLAFARGAIAPNQHEQIEQLYAMLRENFEITGNETINGYDAVIVEGTIDGQLQKLWISTEHALPVKMQSYDEQGSLLIGVEFVDIATQPLHDQIFELPMNAEEIPITDFLGSLQ